MTIPGEARHMIDQADRAMFVKRGGLAGLQIQAAQFHRA